MRVGVAPNSDPDGSNWAIMFAGHSDDEDEDAPEEVGVVCLTDDSDIPEVTNLEYRFLLYENSADEPVGIYEGVCLHRHEEDTGECETFHSEDGETDLDDVPSDLLDGLNDLLSMEVFLPGDEPIDAEPVLVEDVMASAPDPRGFY